MNSIAIIDYIMALGIGIVTTSMCIPLIIKISKKNNFFDKNDQRKIHVGTVPHFGGIALFIGFLLSQSFLMIEFPQYRNQIVDYNYILLSSLIIFILGFIDDLVDLDSLLKFAVQLVVAFITVHKGGVAINSFYGLFGIYDLSIHLSYILSILVVVFFINAFNLIDGIDTLCGAISIYSIIIFMAIFNYNNLYPELMIAVSLLGTLVAFIYYNIIPKTIFLGDSGALFIGYIISFFVIISFNLTIDLDGTKSPVFIISIVAYPVIDTTRVFLIRVYNKVPPFRADRNHIHHGIVDLGFTHKKTSFILLSLSIILSLLTYIIRNNINYSFLFFIVIIVSILFLYEYILIKFKS